jgi:hypothetical protein
MQKLFALALVGALAEGFFAGAQITGSPGDTDYSTFSQFITQRNIFDPNRYPHEARSTPAQRHFHSSSAPSFTLVGTMTYAKGIFAFFNGNNDEFKKVLPLNGTIAGYSITDITVSSATLRGADKKDLTVRIGDQLRQENNGWELVAPGDSVTSPATSENNNPAASPDGSQTAAPSASLGSNDVLKRLMQLREQENK